MVTMNSFLLVFMMQTLIASSITSTEPSSELEQEIRQMRIELCASEIDRNKITSALNKFNKFTDSDQVIKDIVKYYLENYHQNFDNVLIFLNEVKSDVKQNAYQTLFNMSDSNVVGVRDVLHMYSFIKQNESENEVSNQFYETVESATTRTLIKSNVSELVNYANDDRNQEKMFNLIPLIVRSIYNNDHKDITKLLELSENLTNFTQKIKLLHLLLKQAIPDNNVRHLFLLIHQVKAAKDEFYSNGEMQLSNKCLLFNLEKDIPEIFKPYLSSFHQWNVKNIFNNEYLHWYTSSKFQFDLLQTNVSKEPEHSIWRFVGTFFDDSSVIANRYSHLLLLDKCIHDDSFIRLSGYGKLDALSTLRSLWTVEIDDEMQFVQIKNSLTGEYLSVDYENSADADNNVELHRVVLSKKANEKTKWLFEIIRTNSGYVSENECLKEVYVAPN